MRIIPAFLVSLSLVAVAISASAEDAPKPPPFGIKLLPGYPHEPKQGFDSVVGVISKKDGLTIMYEIGRVAKPGGLALGGDFADRTKQLRASSASGTRSRCSAASKCTSPWPRTRASSSASPRAG